MGYWRQFFTTWGKETYRTWRWELFAALLVSGVVCAKAYIDHAPNAVSDFKTALYANAIVLGGFALWHLIRTPYLLHKEAEERHAKEVAVALEQGKVARNAGPNLRSNIVEVLRDAESGGRFFVHAYLVNASDNSATIKKVSLINHMTGRVLEAVPFKTVNLYTNSKIEFHISVNEQGVKSEHLKRSPIQLPDLLDSLKSEALLKGNGKDGWLCFKQPYDLKEMDTTSFSLEIEDAFGNLHKSLPLETTYQLGAFA